MDMGTIIGIVGVLALVGTILTCIMIVPKSKEGAYTGFLKVVQDYFLMKYLVIEAILRFFFILNTLAVILFGFFFMFADIGGYVNRGLMILGGLLIMIIGPIVFRLSYELVMLPVLLLKNTMEINAKVKGDGSKVTDMFSPDFSSAINSIRPQHPYGQPMYGQQPMYGAPGAPVQSNPYSPGPAPAPAPQPQAAPAPQPAPAPQAPAAPAPQPAPAPAPEPVPAAEPPKAPEIPETPAPQPAPEEKSEPVKEPETPKAPEAPAKKFCPSCGKEVSETAAFCKHCGSKI